jgi:hypothetical protein
MGFMGSWLLSWATSNFRKRSDWSCALVVPTALVAVVAVDEETAATIAIP